MSLAKITVSGNVVKTPEKRFTSNNVPITTFIIEVQDGQENFMLNAKAKGNLAELVVQNLNKNDKVVIEGRLLMVGIKAEDGSEKKVSEVDVSSFEKISNSSQQKTDNNNEIVKFAQTDFSDELIGEDEIPF